MTYSSVFSPFSPNYQNQSFLLEDLGIPVILFLVPL